MSSVRNLSLASQSTGDTQHNVHDAALRGASLAFSKPPLPPRPQVNTHTGAGNGALLAATRVGTPIQRERTGDSSLGARRANALFSQDPGKNNSSNSLSVPEDQFDQSLSSSNIAARLATTRHGPLRQTPPDISSLILGEKQRLYLGDELPPAGSVASVVSGLQSHSTGQQPQRDNLDISSTGRTMKNTEHIEKYTDDTPIPPTISLVKLFEQNQLNTPSTHSTYSIKTVQDSSRVIRSPKQQHVPQSPLGPRDDVLVERSGRRTPPPVKAKPQYLNELSHTTQVDDASNSAYLSLQQQAPTDSFLLSQKPTKLEAMTKPAPPLKPLAQRGISQTRPSSEDNLSNIPMAQRLATTEVSLSPPSILPAKEEQDVVEKLKPALPPPRRSNARASNLLPTTAESRSKESNPIRSLNQSQKPPPILPPRKPLPAGSHLAGPSSPLTYHNNYQRESLKQVTKHMTGESMASAIMGAAIATTSRNASPAPRSVSIGPPLPPRKKHHHVSFHRSPSPQKQSPHKPSGKLHTTLRREPSSSEETDEMDKYKKKGTRVMGIKARKHPNKHHEATRRRWRDIITEAERKRYEGVWAANKGVYLPTPQDENFDPEDDPSSDVINILVRELWIRSRLPTHVLKEIWDLVDRRGLGRLSRCEFVVGMWLIDQKLKGRRLPVKVSDSVWQSAQGISLNVSHPH